MIFTKSKRKLELIHIILKTTYYKMVWQWTEHDEEIFNDWSLMQECVHCCPEQLELEICSKIDR